jgi:dihydroflavonol-4-reductase
LSNSVLVSILSGVYPAVPKLFFCTVDGMDVARAHVDSMESSFQNERYIVSNEHLWMRDLAVLVKKLYPSYPVPLR